MFVSFVIAAGAALFIGIMLFVASQFGRFRRAAQDHGYDSLADYMRAAPVTDEEKREALDLAMYGLAFCVLGLGFPALLLLGVFPLFFGVRKVLLGTMGLGLVDEAGDA